MLGGFKAVRGDAFQACNKGKKGKTFQGLRIGQIRKVKFQEKVSVTFMGGGWERGVLFTPHLDVAVIFHYRKYVCCIVEGE